MTAPRYRISSAAMAKGYSGAQKQVFRDRLNRLIDARGYTQADLIRKCAEHGLTVKSSSMSQWVKGQYIPIHATVKILASILGTTDDYLLGRTPAEEFPLKIEDVRPVAGRDLRVFGSAEGGGGVMIIDSDPIEYMARPQSLEGVPSAFAVYVVNDSMAPAFDPGDRVYIRPSVPIVAGNYVLFIRADEHGVRHALIKKLVRATEKSWQVEQFNPHKVFELARSQWQTAYRIVGSDRAG